MKDYILIKTDTLRSFASNARRLGVVSKKLTTEEMLRIFSSVSTGKSDNGWLATMQIPANQSIVPEVTAYINDVTMEGETA